MSLFEDLQHRRGRVLFVSRTNSCRDQMAEAFARALGDDALVAFSAGIAPDAAIPEAVRAVMAEKNLPLFRDQRPKRVTDFDLSGFDIIVNFSGVRLPQHRGLLLEPMVPSAIPGDLESHRAVRDRLEIFARFLVEHFRRAKEWTPSLNPATLNPPAPGEANATAARQTNPTPRPAAAPLPDASPLPAF